MIELRDKASTKSLLVARHSGATRPTTAWTLTAFLAPQRAFHGLFFTFCLEITCYSGSLQEVLGLLKLLFSGAKKNLTTETF